MQKKSGRAVGESGRLYLASDTGCFCKLVFVLHSVVEPLDKFRVELFCVDFHVNRHLKRCSGDRQHHVNCTFTGGV